MIRPSHPILRAAVFGAMALTLGLTLSACGRRGPLDPPPASSSLAPQPAELDTDAQGRPIAPPGPKRRLPIDWLLD